MKRLLLLGAMLANVSAAAAGEAVRSPATFQLPPLENFAEVTARPLFSPDRRPREAAPIEMAASPLALKGIVVNGPNRYAVVEEGTPPAPKRVAEGQALDAGTIKRIDRDHIVLALRNGPDVIVKLFETAKQTKADSRDNNPNMGVTSRPTEIQAASHSPLAAGPGAR